MRSFPFYHQRDAMDCGPTCLMMIAAYHGKKYQLTYLRERSYISRDGVSAKGIMEAAESIGFRTMTVKVPFDTGQDTASLLNAPTPCIAHWNQNHFVVVYAITKQYIWVSDPGAGKFKLARKDFEKSWLSDANQGILILLEAAPQFYENETSITPVHTRLRAVFEYVVPYYRLVFQMLIGMMLGSTLMLIFPFLTQSIIDFGIDTRNIGFIYLILLAQLTLFSTQIIVHFLQSRILMYIGTRINVAMVNDFLAKLMRLPIGFFDTKMTGDLMQRINDQSRVEAFLTHAALPVVFSLFNFVIFSAILLLYNPLIFGVFVIAATLYILWITFSYVVGKNWIICGFNNPEKTTIPLLNLLRGCKK